MPFPEHGVRRCSKCGEWKPYDLLFPKGMGFGVRVRVLARGRKVRRPRPWCRECEYGAKMERVGGKRGEGVGIG
jgi:hypothetical protein